MQTAKSRTKTKELSDLAKLFRQTRRALLYAFLFSFCLNLVMLLLPIYSLQVLDRVISSHSYETLSMLTLITVVGFLFYGAFSLARTYILNGVTDWLDLKLAPKLLEMAIVKSSFGAPSAAGQYQRDLGLIKQFIQNGAPVLMDVPWSILFILVIYMISPVLGFLSVVGVVILLAFAIINELATKKPFERAQENNIHSMQIVEIAGRNADAVESMGMMNNVIANWNRHNDKGLAEQGIGTRRAAIVQSTSRTVRMVIQIAVTGIGAFLALQNELTVGGMIASSILVGRALAPFEGAIGVWKVLITGRDAYHRLDQAIATTPQLRGTMPLPRPQGHLTAEGLFFQPPGSNAIIKNVNFVIEPGESLGIIGPSAAGKSTLAKLIMGILPPTHGSVRLDGAETFKWNREDFGRYVGYMPQHVDLFNGTIKDNIARLDMDADPEEVIAAAQLAGCHEMILRLPGGYETEFMQGNLSLSPGQRQRIGLARALYKRPQFVVLDEPNGNLDGEGERALIASLQRMKQSGITFIVVAHRPSIVSSVDKILMLRGGMVEAFGGRDEVLKHYVAQGNKASADKQPA
jgi:ATP-binding cassette subfamily B protein